MRLSYERPVDLSKHPLVSKKYNIPTPAIDAIATRVAKQIRLRSPGVLLYGYPRFGKTRGIEFVIDYIQSQSPGAVCINFRCETHKSGSEDSFFAALLLAAQHADPLSGKIARKRVRLIEFISVRCEKAGVDWVVFFADEAQKLWNIEYEWLRDVYDLLEKRGIRMIPFLVGQPQLLQQKSALRLAHETQIILRFMVTEIRFQGLDSVQAFATCLHAYDTTAYPAGSAWTYTRFFFPHAFDAGLRLAKYAGPFWRAFQHAHRLAGLPQPMEIPMEYFARAVEAALIENTLSDKPEFEFSPELWARAVEDSTYLLAAEEMKQNFPLPKRK
jgi:hypothetical protein